MADKNKKVKGTLVKVDPAKAREAAEKLVKKLKGNAQANDLGQSG